MADRQDLERIQKAALKIILGKDYDGYENSLKVLNMESLNQRRESMALKFVKNSLKNHNFSKLFPLRKANHGMSVRNGEKYHVNITNTGRYKDSAVPFLQRPLNKDIMDKKDNLKRLISHVKVSKKIERSEIENSRVNYVSRSDFSELRPVTQKEEKNQSSNLLADYIQHTTTSDWPQLRHKMV